MSSNDVRDIFSLPGPSTSTATTASSNNTVPSNGGGSSSSSTANAAAAPSSSSSRSRHRSSSKSRHTHHGPPGSAKPAKPKLDGMTRELFALLGDNAPSLAMAQGLAGSIMGAADGKGGFRPKFKRRPGKAKRWEWTPFRNPAREDTRSDGEDEDGDRKGLVLYHWAPAKPRPSGAANEATASPAIEDEYKFTQFNTSSGVYSYSNDEYIQHLRDEDWTKEETDHLIDLCQAYDLRFVVIHDRYDWPGKQRSMEDLKARYYAICRRLIRSRISTEDIETRQALLSTYSFDKQREVERKKALARLYTRTPAQLAEEEALYVEVRRIEQNEARFASEREELLRLLGGWESLPNSAPHSVAAAGSGVPALLAIGSDEAGGASGSADGKRAQKRRKIDDDANEAAASISAAGSGGGGSAPTTGRAGGSTSGLTSKQRQELKQAQYDDQHCITRFDPEAAAPSKPPYPHLIGVPSTSPPVAPSPANPSSAHGVYLRSARLLTARPNLALRAAQTLTELVPSIGPKLVFPTPRNAEKWEGLMGAVTSGLEMKRQLDRVEAEVRIAKQRLADAQSALQAAQAAKLPKPAPS
ncbi:swr complex subunit [Thecaphora frezii]